MTALLFLGALISSALSEVLESKTEPEVTLSVTIPVAPPLRSQLGGKLLVPCYFLDSSASTPTPPAALSHCIKWSHVTRNRTSVVLVASGGYVQAEPKYAGRVTMVNYPQVPTDGSMEIRGLRSSDTGTYRCEVMDGFRRAEDSVDAEVQGIVFHHRATSSGYSWDFEQAVAACSQIGTVIASPAQLQAAYEDGMHQSDAGWLADRTVRSVRPCMSSPEYPIQYPREGFFGDQDTFPGLWMYGEKNLGETYDVYCFAQELRGRVFYSTSLQKFTFREAEEQCMKLGARLASPGQLYLAWQAGLDMCGAGWLADKSVRYPINTARTQCRGGVLGVHTVYLRPSQTGYPTLDSRYDAICYQEEGWREPVLLRTEDSRVHGPNFTRSTEVLLRRLGLEKEARGEVVTQEETYVPEAHDELPLSSPTSILHSYPIQGVVQPHFISMVTAQPSVGGEFPSLIDAEPTLSPTGVVFHYRGPSPGSALTFEEAQWACQKVGGVIASPLQLHAALRTGLHGCIPAWLSDQSVRYPIVSPGDECWAGLVDLPAVMSQGVRPGVERHDVYCYAHQLNGEISHIGSIDGFTYTEAVIRCGEQGARLASPGELFAAWRRGYDKCRAGWLSDGSVRYPLTSPRPQCGEGTTGVYTVYAFHNQTGYPNPSNRYDTYCFREPPITSPPVYEVHPTSVTPRTSVVLLGSGSGPTPEGLFGSGAAEFVEWGESGGEVSGQTGYGSGLEITPRTGQDLAAGVQEARESSSGVLSLSEGQSASGPGPGGREVSSGYWGFSGYSGSWQSPKEDEVFVVTLVDSGEVGPSHLLDNTELELAGDLSGSGAHGSGSRSAIPEVIFVDSDIQDRTVSSGRSELGLEASGNLQMGSVTISGFQSGGRAPGPGLQLGSTDVTILTDEEMMEVPALQVVSLPTTSPLTPPGLGEPPTAYDGPGCEDGWAAFEGHCYLHVPRRATWEAAERHCQDRQSHLASIHSQQEQEFITAFTQDYQWIGLNDMKVHNDFQWTDGSHRRYENWCRKQPDSFHSGEDCVVIIWHEEGRWNDVSCSYQLPFTCKTRPAWCGAPPEVLNARVIGKKREQHRVGSAVRYQCNAGFSQRHPPVVRCIAGGQWERPRVECVSSTKRRCRSDLAHLSHR